MKKDNRKAFMILLAISVALFFVFVLIIGSMPVKAAPPVFIMNVWIRSPDGEFSIVADFTASGSGEPYNVYSDRIEFNGQVLANWETQYEYSYATFDSSALSQAPDDPLLSYQDFTVPFEFVPDEGYPDIILFGPVDPGPPPVETFSVVVRYPNGNNGWSSVTLQNVLPDVPVNFNSNGTVTQDGRSLGSIPGTWDYATLDKNILNELSGSDLRDYVTSTSFTVPFEYTFFSASVIIFFNDNSTPPPPETVELNVYAPVNNQWVLIYEGDILKDFPYTFGDGSITSEAGTLVSDSRLEGFQYISLNTDILSQPVESESLVNYINGEVPYEQAFSSGAVWVIYFNAYEPPLSVPVLSIDNDFVLHWTKSSDEDIISYQLNINGNVVNQTYPLMTSYDCYAQIDDVGHYTFQVRAVQNKGGTFFYSDWSNSVAYVASEPVISQFEISDNVLSYSFSGPKSLGDLYQVDQIINSDISPGSYTYDLSSYVSGLYGFKLIVQNKYGQVVSDSLDFYVGFSNDTNGTFYSIGVIMGNIVSMFDSIEFFGISLWMMMCTSFVITLIIPFICIFVLPSSPVRHGYTPRGGNGKRSHSDGSASDSHPDDVRGRMQQYGD